MTPDPALMRPATILIVDDDLVTVRTLGKALEGLGKILFAMNGVEALRVARSTQPDLILLDGEMPGMSGYEVCKALKEDPELAHVPVVFVTSHAQLDFEESGFGCGAADFIAKPIRPSIVAARARTQIGLKLATDRLRELSATDGLTGLANRRAFDDSLEREWRRALRSGEPLSLLMIDVDHFKRFNDRYGHPAGDTCLAQVARTMNHHLRRPGDVAARYGGEEFALLLPATDRQGAMALGQRLLEAVRDLGIPHAESDCGPFVTVSVGVSSFDQASEYWHVGVEVSRSGSADSAEPADLVAAADGALYTAKRAGRGRSAWMGIDDVTRRRLADQPLP